MCRSLTGWLIVSSRSSVIFLRRQQPFKKNKEKKLLHLWQAWALSKDCPNDKWKPKKKSANMIEADGGTSRYGTVLSVVHSPDWWVDTGANIHVCADIFCFLLIRTGGLPPC